MWDLSWYWYILMYFVVCPFVSIAVFYYLDGQRLNSDEKVTVFLSILFYPLTIVYTAVWLIPQQISKKLIERKKRLEKERKEKEKKEAEEKKLRERVSINGEADSFRDCPRKGSRCIKDY